MRTAVVLLVGVGLNLGIAFAPLWLVPRDAFWFRPEHVALALGLTLLLLADATGRSEVNSRSSTREDGRAFQLAQVTGFTILALVWGALWERRVSLIPPSPWQISCGIALMILGSTLRAAAVQQLGSQFVSEVTPAIHNRLVRSGIYSKIRHPSETGLLLALAGIAITLDSPWAALGAAPIFMLLTWLRLRLEEAALRSAFGESYNAYCREVGALWPKWP